VTKHELEIADYEAAEALQELHVNSLCGYTRFANSGFGENHRLTTNDSNGPLMTKPPVYQHPKKLPPVKFGQRQQ
jgi:hypothetical protein